MSKRFKLIPPTEEEDAAINAGIALDADNLELTEEDFKHMRPAAEVVPEIVKAYRRTRGSQKAPRKISITVRLSPEVLAYFKATGRGWQIRLNEALKEWVAEHKKGP